MPAADLNPWPNLSTQKVLIWTEFKGKSYLDEIIIPILVLKYEGSSHSFLWLVRFCRQINSSSGLPPLWVFGPFLKLMENHSPIPCTQQLLMCWVERHSSCTELRLKRPINTTTRNRKLSHRYITTKESEVNKMKLVLEFLTGNYSSFVEIPPVFF